MPRRSGDAALLRHAQRLESLGVLAGGVAHDFNNILTAILMNQRLALMDLHNPEAVKARLLAIGQASLRAKELVAQILDFANQRPVPVRRAQSLGPVVEEAMALVRASAPPSVEISTEIASDCPCVFADPIHIHQIVVNLCTNAEYAMRGRDGTLRVTVQRFHEPATAARSWPELPPGDYARLSVADTGVGMTEEIARRIFNPFFTTKPVGEGTGLGLAVIQAIIQEYRGAIHVRSEINVGTLFEVMLPAAE